MATYNREAYIGAALENFRAFITPEDELIIVDGGSTDRTLEILEEHRDMITTLVSERDLGESHALNKGLLLARCEIIKFLTDDDYFDPDAIRAAVDYMKQNPETDLLMCGGETYTTGGRKVDSITFPEGVPFDTSFYFAYRYRIISGLGWIIRRSVLAKVGLFDLTARAVDIVFLSKLYSFGANIRCLNINLYKHYHHEDSGMTRYERECNNDIIRSLREHGLRWQAMLRVVRYWRNIPGKILFRALMKVDDLVWKLHRPSGAPRPGSESKQVGYVAK